MRKVQNTKLVPLVSLPILLFGFSFFTACGGDVKTIRDAELLRNRAQINQRLSELEPLVGEYEGKILDDRTDRSSKFKINIVLSGKSYDNSNLPDEVTAPTLSASVLFYGVETASDTYVTFSFSRSDYDAKTKKLIFYSTDPDGSLSAVVQDQKLSGVWMVSNRGTLGKFDVTKVQP